MKRSFIITLAAVLLTLVSCVDTSLDPLTGIFPDAQEFELTTLTGSSFEKTATNRVFTLSFSGSGGATVEASLVGARAQYYLESNVYGPGESTGCYLVGPTTVNGKMVKSGNITVQKKDGDRYKLIFVLFDADGNPYRTKWEGDIVYEPDPEPVTLTKVLIAQVNANGTVTFKLGTDGMSIDGMGTPTGDGYALTADVYSEDGVLHEGVYTASASSDVVGPGQYAPGYEYDLSSWGMGIMHWGTCWWAGDACTHINQEPITVEKKGAKFVITWGSEETYPHWATFTGEIEELAPSDLPTPDYTISEVVGDVTDASWATVPGVKAHYITLTGRGSDEVKAQFTLILAEGVNEIAGTYSCMEYASEPYKMGNGYDLSAYGWGIGGSLYYENGNLVLINPGETMEVVKYAEGLYGFIGSTGYNFVAATDAYSGGGGDFSGVELTQFCGLVDYFSMYQVNLVGMELATAGVTVTAGAWGNTYGGDGNYIKLELYTADGSVAPGTYTPCATGGEVTEGTFGIGYDGMWGASGTTWYTLSGGTATSVYVTDGTVTVEVEGDIYTITLQSSTVNAQYKGKLSAD